MNTHGEVFYEDGIKAAEEYGVNRKANAKISFDTEGSDYTSELAKAAEQAKNVVNVMLGKSKAAVDTGAGKGGEAPTDKPKRTTAKKETAAPEADSFPLDNESKPADSSDAAEWEVGDEAEAAEDLSDAAMTKIVTDINKKLKKPGEIKEIIKKYNPPGNSPSSLGAIKKEKRSAFLKELRAFAAQG